LKRKVEILRGNYREKLTFCASNDLWRII
jgi:hypothetical protein